MTTSQPSQPAGGEADEPVDPPGPDWLYRWRRRWAGDNRLRQMMWRAVATGIGGGIIAVGVMLLVLPGPGWALIFLGLAVLATEYAWAHRLLRFTRDKAQGAASTAMAPQNRKRTLVLLLIAALLVAAVVAWYVQVYGWTLSGATGWFGFG